MKRLILLVVMVGALIFSVLNVGVLASEEMEASFSETADTIAAAQETEALSETVSGTCGESLIWTLEEGVLTISGEGAIPDYKKSSSMPWYDHWKEITSVVICPGVTAVGNRAFTQHTRIVTVTMSDSVTSIGDYAFSGCTGLESISIPEGVSSIGIQAFYNCLKLKQISIPEGVSAIGSWTFKKCPELESVTIPVSVVSVGERAFDGCTALTDVYYAGSPAQWDKISIESTNTPLTSASIHFAVSNIAGDANGDGGVDILDVIRLVRALARADVKIYGDVTGDGVLDEQDLVRLMRYLVGDDVEVY